MAAVTIFEKVDWFGTMAPYYNNGPRRESLPIALIRKRLQQFADFGWNGDTDKFSVL